MGTLVQPHQSLAVRVEAVLGQPEDLIEEIEIRSLAMLSDFRTVVWEADATTLECTCIGSTAEALLGYPREVWTGRAGFWAEIIHPDDRDEALANCALCAGRGRGHNFGFRAIDASGNVHRFFNVLRVVRGPRKLAVKLRGILFEVPDSVAMLTQDDPLMQIGIQEVQDTVEF